MKKRTLKRARQFAWARRSDATRKAERRLGRGVPVPLAPPGATLIKVRFQLKQVADVGTTNPIVARLQMQVFDLVDALGLAKAERDEILEHMFVGSQWFVGAEKNKNEFVCLSHNFRKAAEGSGVRFQGTTMPIVLEPLNLGDHYQLFSDKPDNRIEIVLQGNRAGVDRTSHWMA